MTTAGLLAAMAAVPAAGAATASPAVTPNTFVVNSTGDGADASSNGVCQTATAGECTLRAAVQEANKAAGAATINFAIPGAGLHTIAPATALPALTNPNGITVDGFSQAGTSPNTDPLVDNAVRTIDLVGQGPKGIDGFFVVSSNNTIRGLIMHAFNRPIWIYGDAANSNYVVGNLLGLTPTGDIDPTYALYGPSSCVVIQGSTGGASYNHVGTAALADRNTISGCNHQGVALYNIGTDHNYIQNNIIGLDPTGTKKRGVVSHGIDINTGAQYTMIGGPNPGEGNLISGNNQEGAEISHNPYTLYNSIIGNRIGTDPTGTSAPLYARNGQWGVHLEGYPNCNNAACPEDAGFNTVTDNVIVNSERGGIMVDKGVHDSVIARNKIGVLANGTPAGNLLFGINMQAGSVRNVIGPDNEIAYNDTGIQMESDGVEPPNSAASPTNRNRITKNSIHDNGTGGVTALGIDLQPFGSTNTLATADPSTNDAMLPPVLGNAHAAYVDATTCASCTVELFVSDRPAGSFGSGTQYLASAVADGSGTARVFVPVAGRGKAVTATATNSSGSTSEFSKNVTIPATNPANHAPTAAFTPNCSHLTCTFDASASTDVDPGDSIINYAWDFGDGTTGDGVTTAHTFTAGGTFSVNLTVTDGDAATSSVAHDATSVNLPPTAAFNFSCTFGVCSFDGTSSTDPDGPIATYTWNFGDGATGNGAAPAHNYANSGSYDVTLTVNDGNGSTNALTQSISVTALPVGTLAYDTYSRTVANGLGNADVGGAYAGNGASSDYAVGSGVGRITLSTVGAGHTAALAATNARDSDTRVDIASDIAPNGVNEVAGPTARHVNNNLEYRLKLRFQPGGAVKLSLVKVVNSTTEVAIGNELPLAFTYAPGQMISTRLRVTGINPTTLQAKAWLAGNSEPAAWTLNVTDSESALQVNGTTALRTFLGAVSGAVATSLPVTWSFDNLVVQVIDSPPTAAFTSSCTNSKCTFDASGSSDPDDSVAAYAWDFGDGTSFTGSGVTGVNPTHDYGPSGFGTHSVTLTVTDNYTETATVAHDVDPENVAPVATFTASCPDVHCTFDASTSADPDGTIASYSWDFGDGATATGATATHDYATADVYTAVLVVTDSNGATDATSQTFTVLPVNALPTAAYTFNCTVLTCSFDTTGSSDSDGTIASHSWDFADGTNSTGSGAPDTTLNHTFTSSGTYNVKLSVTDDRGGVGTVTKAVTVTSVNAPPTANATFACTLMACTFDGTTSTDSDGTVASYAWNFGDATSATTATTSHTYSLAGTWPVTLTVTDNKGATASTKVYAVVAPAPAVSLLANDTFTRSTANAWGTADKGGAWTVNGTAANYKTNGAAGVQHLTASGGSNTAYLPGVKVNDVDVQVRVASTAAASASIAQSVMVVTRKASTNNEYRLRLRFTPSGVYVVPVKLAGSATATLIGTEVLGPVYAPNTFYRVRVQTTGVNPTTIRAKVWKDGTAEPAAWLFTRTDTTAAIQAAGVTGLTSSRAASTAVDFTFDDFVVRPTNLAPVAAFTTSCTGKVCSVNASGSTDDGTITTYRWTFGDGFSSSGVTSSRTYAAAGTYAITLTVVDDKGVKTVLSKTVTVT